METIEYVNDPPRRRQKISGDSQQTERRLSRLLFFSFGLLCIIQAILNVSLRLTSYSTSDCNTTHAGDHDQGKEVQTGCEANEPTTACCNALQERFNALNREKSLLENRISELNNQLRRVREQRDVLQMKLNEMSSSASPSGCSTGWREINSRCYFLSGEMKTWAESRKYCQGEGADLVVINSEDKQRALYRLDGDAYLLFWIGVNATDGTFKWVDGSALTKAFWQSGQPGDGGPNNAEDCVEMYHNNPVLTSWNDAPCGKKRLWLCEKDPQ